MGFVLHDGGRIAEAEFLAQKIQCRTFGASVFCLFLAQDLLKHVQLSVCAESGIESHCLTRISLVPPSGTFGCFGMEFPHPRIHQCCGTLTQFSCQPLYRCLVPAMHPQCGTSCRCFFFFTVSLLAACHWMWWNENGYCRC